MNKEFFENTKIELNKAISLILEMRKFKMYNGLNLIFFQEL
jgi:hypothetical protein